MNGQQPNLMQPRSLDLFGQVPVLKADVYAWLLAVPQIDPANPRAFAYVRDYGVIQKITAAKLEGRFDEITAATREGAQYRVVVECDLLAGTTNAFGVGEWEKIQRRDAPLSTRRKAPNRPRAVIRREKVRRRQEIAARKQINSSMLCRLPTAIPPFSVMLEDIGSPAVHPLAKAMGFSVQTAKKWIEADEAPLAVKLALFWITRWGATDINSRAHNDAVMYYGLAKSGARQVTELQGQIEHVERLADFGSANDPLPTVKASPPLRRLVIPQAPPKAAASLTMARSAARTPMAA